MCDFFAKWILDLGAWGIFKKQGLGFCRGRRNRASHRWHHHDEEHEERKQAICFACCAGRVSRVAG